jgi:signal transduction histidine kinase/ActR/RegA family two-component response regulator
LVNAAKTLHDIRSDACNAILATLTLLAFPAVGFSLLRGLEQGWRPVMGLHVALLLLLLATTAFRKKLSLTLRAGVVTAVPYLVATSGIIAFGRGNGVMMFYVSAIAVAGCFFERRIALGVVGLCVASIAAIYTGYRLDLLPLPLTPTSFDMTPLSWTAFSVGFMAAGIPPLIGLSALLRSLDAERTRADEAAKVRSEFLANMSHELRTPMTGILGMADVLKTTPLSDQQHTLIANLTLSARNLLAVLNDVLDFAKFETGAVPIERAPFRVTESLQNICAVFENRAAQRGVALRIEQPRPITDHVVGDALRIGQVLTNLIDNAIKFTPRGTVVVRVEQRISDDVGFDMIYSVIDTGIGIAPEHMERIFEPFIQADMSTSRNHGGTGLGLSICRHLVTAMGGELKVSSQPHSGSAFTFSIPVQRALAPPVPIGRAFERMAPPAPRISKMPLRLLVADDDKNMRILADIMLLRRGFEVTLVEDGAAAVEAATAGEYDCVIVDMHMPVMNGREVMRAIRKTELQTLSRRTPLIALTADVVADHVRAFVEAGADAVVAKPVEWNQLEAKILELVSTRTAAKAS